MKSSNFNFEIEETLNMLEDEHIFCYGIKRRTAQDIIELPTQLMELNIECALNNEWHRGFMAAIISIRKLLKNIKHED